MTITDILEAIRALGIAGGPVFAVLWWLERTDRKVSQKDTNNFLIQLLNVTNQSTISISEVTKAVTGVAADTDAFAVSLSQLAQLIKTLNHTLRQRRS